MERKKVLISYLYNPWLFLGLIYIVGVFLHEFDSSFEIALKLTPFVILITLSYVTYVAKIFKNKELSIILISIALIGFIAEILGVNWGYLFGDYNYGSVLSIKIFNVPVIIAMNWAFVIFGAYAITRRYMSNKLLLILIVPILVVIFDIIMEPVAISYGYWTWDQVDVPMFNYFTWYVISIISVVLLIIVDTRKSLKDSELKAPSILFLMQLLFFSVLGVLS